VNDCFVFLVIELEMNYIFLPLLCHGALADWMVPGANNSVLTM